jgi:hypothetical protein
MDTFIWITKNGDEIPINELTPGHLLNIHKMLSRRLFGLQELQDFQNSIFAPGEYSIAAEILDN